MFAGETGQESHLLGPELSLAELALQGRRQVENQRTLRLMV
jgi:hypothetical protein